jgi:hypothetical protein
MKVLKSKMILVIVCLSFISFASFVYAEDLKVEKIVDDVYCIHQGDTNSGFFKFKDKVYVIDSHFPIAISEKQKELIHSQFKTEKIEVLIDTNINIDSIAGNQTFSGESWILSSEAARSKLSEKGESLLTDTKGILDEKELQKVKVFPANITFEKKLNYYDGNNVIEIYDAQDVYSTGNLLINIKGKNVIFAGLLFFNKIIPDLKDAKLRDYQKEIENISKLSASKIVPRFGPVGSFDDFLSYKEYIDTLVTETQNFIKKGSTIEETLDGVKIVKFKDWKFYSERHPLNVQKAYDELKKENNQILDFLKAIQQQKKTE